MGLGREQGKGKQSQDGLGELGHPWASSPLCCLPLLFKSKALRELHANFVGGKSVGGEAMGALDSAQRAC